MRISRADLIIPEKRQRKLIEKRGLSELKDSILQHGLLHAPVVQAQPDGKFILVAGERRTRAIDLIIEETKVFFHSKEYFGHVARGHEVFEDTLPVVLLDEALTLAQRGEVELAENVDRVELPWQDKMEALAYIHSLKKEANP